MGVVFCRCRQNAAAEEATENCRFAHRGGDGGGDGGPNGLIGF